MDDLRDWFRRILRQRLAALKTLQADGGGGPHSSLENRAEIDRVVHSLKGTCGFYGFKDIGEAAGKVEESDLAGRPVAVGGLVALLERVLETPLAGQRLLVVEDDVALAKVIEERFQSEGMIVGRADSGRQADLLLSCQLPDFVLLDLVLPDMDGRTLLRRWREDPATAALPVVVVSCHLTRAIERECKEWGVTSCLAKPYDLDQLEAILRKTPHQNAGSAQVGALRDPATGLPSRVAACQWWNQCIGEKDDLATKHALTLLQCKTWPDPILPWVDKLLDHFPKADMIARWSEDSFLIVHLRSQLIEIKSLCLAIIEPAVEGPVFLGQHHVGIGLLECTSAVPLSEAAPDAYRAALSALNASGAPVIVNEGKTGPSSGIEIAIVEDDLVVAGLLTHRLGREGYRVSHYASPRHFLEPAGKIQQPDLFVLDVKLPGMDGFEMLDQLRHHAPFEKTPILMLTSMGSDRDIVRGLSQGANDYLCKPFSPSELLARVHRLLRVA